MHISPELFAQIVSAMDCAEISPPHEGWDNRARPRLAVQGTAMIVPLIDRLGRRPARVVMRDISTVGVGILFDKPMRMNEQFALRLPLTDTAPLWIVCTVTRFRPVSEDTFGIGATFSHILSTSDRDDQSLASGYADPTANGRPTVPVA